MPACVESMFYVRKPPWHGLGTCVEEALTSGDALRESGLDWSVFQRPILTDDQIRIPGYKANIRDTDNRILGVVSDRYKIVQNHEAFAFVDALLGEGVRFETAGSLHEGRKVWILAKLPNSYSFDGEDIDPYLVFSNSHDGNSSIRVAMTPIRVVCQNTLNLALNSTKRMWSTVHVGNIQDKLAIAQNTLLLADKYMGKLGDEFSRLSQIQLPDTRVMEYIEMLLPMDEEPTEIHRRNIEGIRNDLKIRYFDAPDLEHVGRNAYRFMCAVSDYATHAEPLRKTANYRENVFSKTIDGNPLIDKAYAIVQEAA